MSDVAFVGAHMLEVIHWSHAMPRCFKYVRNIDMTTELGRSRQSGAKTYLLSSPIILHKSPPSSFL